MTITTKSIEATRAILAKNLPNNPAISVNGKTYYSVGHPTPVGTRYNLQVENRWYEGLTLSALAAVITSLL